MKLYFTVIFLLLFSFSIFAQDLQENRLPTNFPYETFIKSGQRELFQPIIMPYILGLCTSVQSFGAIGMDMYFWEGNRDWGLLSEWEFIYQGDLVVQLIASFEGIDQVYTNTIQNGMITETLVQMDMMGAFIDLQRYYYYYDGDLLTSWLAQDSDYIGGWLDFEQGLYTYSGGMMTEYVTQLWNESSSDWENLNQYIVTYNGQNIDEILQQNWSGGWENHYLSEYTYSGSLIDQVLSSYWNGNSWWEDLRETYSYNNNDMAVNILIEEMVDESWENFENIETVFEGDILEEILITDWDGSDWVNFTWTDYIYSNSSEDHSIPASIMELSNFPNPFNPSTTITFELSTEPVANTELVIYNTKGQKIKKYTIFNNQSSIIWDGTDQAGKAVPSGIYFYKLSSAEQSLVKKMLLLK